MSIFVAVSAQRVRAAATGEQSHPYVNGMKRAAIVVRREKGSDDER